jgi:hypothetical protein
MGLKRNPFRVDYRNAPIPRVGRKKRGQPWALGCSPVGAVCQIQIMRSNQMHKLQAAATRSSSRQTSPQFPLANGHIIRILIFNANHAMGLLYEYMEGLHPRRSAINGESLYLFRSCPLKPFHSLSHAGLSQRADQPHFLEFMSFN